MNEFKIYVIIGILLVLSVLIYEFYSPVGISYLNGFEINDSGGFQYNLPKLENSSLFVISANNSTIIFYKNFYNFFLSPFINNSKSIELMPKNKTAYYIYIGNSVCYSPKIGKNITFYYDPSTQILTTYCFNQTINNNVFNSFNVNISSVSSESKAKILILYNQSIKISEPVLSYNTLASFYQPVKITCKSTSPINYTYLYDNYGNKTTSSNGTATLSILAYPNLKVTCYNGEKLISENINFNKLVPVLSLVYRNNTVYCNSTVNSEIYLQIGSEQIVGMGYVSYSSPNLNGTITCIQPGNQYQQQEEKTVNIV